MRKLVVRFLKWSGLHPLAETILRSAALLAFKARERFGRPNRKIVEEYVKLSDIRRLHIGCGANPTDGWLNSDIFPRSNGVMFLNASKPFPIGNIEFDYIFSEHMIEHMTYVDGLRMLAESFRILKKGGVIRVSTPDLGFLVDLYKKDKSELQRQYIKWSTDTFIDDVEYCDDTFVINNFVRNWGHLFIYDEKTLRSSMEKAGFAEISRCDLNESKHASLRNLENDNRMPEGFLRLESFTLEGTKLVEG